MAKFSSSFAHSDQKIVFLQLLIVFAGMIMVKGEFEEEGKALLNSHCWVSHGYNSSSYEPHHCKWHGVFYNAAGSVIQIRLGGCYELRNNYLGNMNFSSLPNLDFLDLSGCGFKGSIPSQIGTLSKLKHLRLSHNLLTGDLPLSLFNLSQLEVLHVSFNSINGTIPPRIGALSKLKHLGLARNDLTGELLLSLFNLSQLEVLDVSINSINGSIPRKLIQLTKLECLYFFTNEISGQIPPEIGKLFNLEILDLSHNKLTGPIPPIGNCTSLTSLILNDNNLNGSIPINLGYTMRSQPHLELSHNNLSGTLPNSLVYFRDLDLLRN